MNSTDSLPAKASDPPPPSFLPHSGNASKAMRLAAMIYHTAAIGDAVGVIAVMVYAEMVAMVKTTAKSSAARLLPSLTSAASISSW